MVSARSERDQTNSLATGPRMVAEERYLLSPLIQQFWILGDNEGYKSQEVLADEPAFNGIADALVGTEYWISRTSV